MSEHRIQILPSHIVNQIAAGEVVERPASVIKELVENALDAGATRIDISASAGGRTLRVADNGYGMSPEDAQMAFYNHATSKVQSDTDLSRIETLGFRGEALASISAIAQVTCYTRPQSLPMGTKVTFTDKGEPQLSPTGCAPGTVMEVEDLFFNIPARLKFLKRPQTELNHIEEMVQYLALSHPETQFTLTLNDQVGLKTQGTGELKSTIEDVFKLNRKDSQDLIAVRREEVEAGISLAGYISPPGNPKSSKRWMVTFVNGRYVRCPIIVKAVEAAYASLIPDGKYPLSVLFLSLPWEDVDMNVHPSKKEVRYVSPNGIFGFVRQNLLETLENNGHRIYQGMALNENSSESSHGHPTQLQPFTFTNSAYTGSSSGSSGYSGGGNSGSYQSRPGGYGPSQLSFRAPMSGSGADTQAVMDFYQPGEASAASEGSSIDSSSWRVIGQLFNTYILLETRQGLMVVDQHIASERTFFEALTRTTMETAPDLQQLIAVAPMPLSPLQHELLSENRERFSQLGFQFELSSASERSDSGDTPQVTLSTLPLIFQGRQPKDIFESLLSQLEETGQMHWNLDNMIATLACHSAVRAGDPLTHDEMGKVVERWLACKLPWTCPHGRPIAHTIATNELHHFFDRHSLPVNALT